jgi:IclR family pca regulon transcriptional regulator
LLTKTKRKPTRPPTERSYHVEAIERGLDVLALFRADRPTMSLVEISRLVDAVPSTTLRIVNTLEDLGFLEAVPGQGTYRAGVASLRLGHAMIAGSPIRALARPSLVRLRDAAHEAVSLGVLQDESVYFVDYCGTDDPLALPMPVGARVPAHCSAAGKAMLAFSHPRAVSSALDPANLKRIGPRTRTSRGEIVTELSKIRLDGYAIADEEVAGGMRSIAAPVLDLERRPVAAIAVAVGSGRYEVDELRRVIAPLLIGAAAEVSARWRAERDKARLTDEASEDARAPPAPAGRSRYHVEALSRGLSTLLAFSPAHARLTLTDIAQRTDSLMSTTFRVVATLSALGYVRTDESTGQYELAPKVLALGFEGLAWLNLAELSLPRLLRFHAETGRSLYLSVLGGDLAVDIVSLGRPGLMSTLGRSYPLYCTPGGKILLAFMPDERREEVLRTLDLVRRTPRTLVDRDQLRAELATIREKGYSVVRDEFLPGSCGAGVPLRDSRGACVASLAAVVRGAESTGEAVIDTLIAQIRDAGDDLSARLSLRFS